MTLRLPWAAGAANRHQQPAVVLGLDCITGLQTARILASKGIPVIGVAADRTHFAARTRVCERVIEAPLHGEELIEELEALRPQLPSDAVLFPCTDLAVLAVSEHRARLGGYSVLLPDHAIVQLLMDKMSFLQHAQTAGLPIPETRLLHSRADAEDAAQEMPYPCVLKPPVKSPTWLRNTAVKAYKVHSPAELLAVYDLAGAWADVLVAQEWVEGGEERLFSCNAYLDVSSRPLVTFVARKLRQWPPVTGTSSLGEACRNDEVLDTTLEVFEGVGFRGLAYLEMKQDARTGRHFIIEPNVGRPTGRSAISEGGGVELLYTAYCDALGLPLPENRVQTDDPVKWLDLRRDLQSAAYYLRRRELTAREWWRSMQGRKRHAVLSVRDPLPMVFEVEHAARKALAARSPGSRGALAHGESGAKPQRLPQGT